VHLVRRPLFGLLYQPRMIDDDECGAVGGMKIGRGNRSTRRKPAPVPLCLPQITHDLTWARTRAAAVGSQRLTPELRHCPTLMLDCLRLLLATRHSCRNVVFISCFPSRRSHARCIPLILKRTIFQDVSPCSLAQAALFTDILTLTTQEETDYKTAQYTTLSILLPLSPSYI
jgi:hypothetical protein